MLSRRGEPFTSGQSRFLDRSPARPEQTAKVFVRVRIGERPIDLMAQLDTGAAWSVVDPETAAQVGVPGEGVPVRLRTALGEKRGRLTRTAVTLLADEGDELEVDATVFVPDPGEPWPVGALFLGYGGLLERVRFALDPSANEFHFGEA